MIFETLFQEPPTIYEENISRGNSSSNVFFFPLDFKTYLLWLFFLLLHAHVHVAVWVKLRFDIYIHLESKFLIIPTLYNYWILIDLSMK